MMRINRGAITGLVLAAIAAVSIAAVVAGSAPARQAPVLPVHERRDVCLTKTMWSRTIDHNGFGDWRYHYTEEISYKASGEFASRRTTSDGKVSMFVAENGQAIEYGADNRAAATSRPFKPAAEFLDENWLAANKSLRKDNPVVEVLGYKAYVLREGVTGDGSYIDYYIAPAIGHQVMVYRYAVRATGGVMESLIQPVSIRVGCVNQDLWDSIPRDRAVVPARKGL